METRRVNSPGAVGSPLTTAMSAPGGNTGGTDHCSDSGSAEDCAIAPGAAKHHTEAAMRTHSRRLTKVQSFISLTSDKPHSMGRTATLRARLSRDRRTSLPLDDGIAASHRANLTTNTMVLSDTIVL